MFELRHLRYFAAVADTLSFARAAERLHISQPPLSRQIQALEQELGTPLFVRSKRSVKLSAAGAALLPEVRRLLQSAEALGDSARRLAGGEAGSITLGCITTAAYNLLPHLLPEFQRRHPGVKVTLREATSDLQLAGLAEGDMDAGLLLPPVDDPRLGYLPLFRDTLVAALPATPPAGAETGWPALANLQPGAPLALRALSTLPFIMFPRQAGPGLYDLILGFCRGAGFSPRIEQQATHMQTIVSLVAAGMGVALVPASLQSVARAGVHFHPLTQPSPAVETGLAWRRDNDSPALRAFVALSEEMRAEELHPEEPHPATSN